MKKENKALAKKKKAAARKRANAAKKLKTILMIVIPCLIVAAAIGLIVYGEIRNNLDYSAGLTDDGYIKGVEVSEYVTLADYSGVSVDEETLVSDEMVDEAIDEQLMELAEVNEKSPITTKEGDKISIDFVGRVDGEEFENGSAEGFPIVIGEGGMIDDFEDQLIGHKVGDKFTIEVTFPEEYGQDASLAGKDAEFDITIKGVYEKPVLTDALVAENFGDVANTVEEYRLYMETQVYLDNVAVLVQDEVVDKCEVIVPESYFKKVKNTYRLAYEAEFNYHNQLYATYVGYYMWDDVYDYFGMTKEEYEANMDEVVTASVKYYMVMQAIFEQEGMTMTEAEVIDHILASGYAEAELEQAWEDFGEGYWWQNAMAEKVMLYIADTVVKG